MKKKKDENTTSMLLSYFNGCSIFQHFMSLPQKENEVQLLPLDHVPFHLMTNVMPCHDFIGICHKKKTKQNKYNIIDFL